MQLLAEAFEITSIKSTSFPKELLFIMKLLMIVYVFTYFFIATEGIECYICADHSSMDVCSKPTIKNCTSSPEYSNQFCATFAFDKEHELFENCSGNCLMKDCMFQFLEHRCKISEPFELSSRDGISANVSCCQGDLCNGSVDDGNSSNKLSNQNILFYAFLFNYIICLV